ncbi:hypothetical protein BCR33DRAFT_852686 [Rhizoclosmatium globosum]|uniref:Homeobox domain-containing protein n=1 Tax=Rhizoclosmatium globosum TaxID=329046 RepID=A0A1Y2C1C6_9FUNG|nr:hypothetical protein BCR33DRAFT_852686 [Rhizoclosmatium globosum]|eukprot:ORY40842.1 hypothetical protein BCR33DRAFT_852686 [Rhizoclosmatium globosum]
MHSLLSMLNMSHTRFAALPKEALHSQVDLSLWQPSPLDQFVGYPSPLLGFDLQKYEQLPIPQFQQLPLPDMGFTFNTVDSSPLAPPPTALSQPHTQIQSHHSLVNPSYFSSSPRSQNQNLPQADLPIMPHNTQDQATHQTRASPSPISLCYSKHYKRVPTPRTCKKRLKELFADDIHPNKERVKEIAEELGMDTRKVRVL